MRISRAGRCNSGFTLLELVVVLFIFSLVLALSLPSLTGLGEDKIQADAKRLASVVRYLNDSAVATKENLSLKVEFRDKVMRYEGPEGLKSERFDSIAGIELQSKGMVTEGEVIIFFGPSGSSESFQFHLRSDKRSLIVAFNGMSGRVKIIQNED
jgi:prepilin-type N-terminal cleavage/methylation domain-containing protein